MTCYLHSYGIGVLLKRKGLSLGIPSFIKNLRAILLENNGLSSSGHRNKHIYLIYLLIKYRTAMGDLKVKYCPSGENVGRQLYQTIARGYIPKNQI